MILNPPPQNGLLVSTPSLRWQEGSVQLDGTVVFISWGLWSIALHPPNQRLPCQPGEGAGSLLDLALFPCPWGRRLEEAWVSERDDAYLCGAVRQLGQGGGPFYISAAPLRSHPPASMPPCFNLPLASTHSRLPSAPQRRLIVYKPLLVSGEQREKTEAPSLSPPAVPPDPGPIF